VRPQGDDPPFELGPSEVATVDGFPQLYGHEATTTLIVSVRRFTAENRKETVMRRSTRHPLLRLDAATDPDRPVVMYGLDAPSPYFSMWSTAVSRLFDDLADVDLEWEWLLSQPLDPVPELLPHPPKALRGRFPGGVGILETREREIAFHAGGQLLALDVDHIDLLDALVGGAPVSGEDFDLRTIAPLLLSVGLAQAA
jgi:hypothetical protein